MYEDPKTGKQIISVRDLDGLDDDVIFAIAALYAERMAELYTQAKGKGFSDEFVSLLSISTILLQRFRDEKIRNDRDALLKGTKIIQEFRKEKFWEILCKKDIK